MWYICINKKERNSLPFKSKVLRLLAKLNFDPNQRQDQKAPFLHQMEEYIGRQFYELNPIDPVFQQAREMLLNAGADFRAEDEWGHRAYFNLYRHRKALGVYVAHGAELEYTDHNGRVRSLLRPRRQGIRDLKEAIMRAGNTPEARQMRTRLGKLENADAEHARHLTVWTSRIRLAYRAEQNDNNPDRTNG